MTTHRVDCGGKSLLELMWESLLDEMGPLMPGGEYAESERPDGSRPSDLDLWTTERARIRGTCQGISSCIALVLNPYAPDVDAVRAEAADRYEGMPPLRMEG